MRPYRISQNFFADADGLHAPDHGFTATWQEIGNAVPGTRVSAVAADLAIKPWCDVAEALRAVQVAAALYGIGPGFCWIETEGRCTARRRGAIEVDRLWRAALRGEPLSAETCK